jgi:hypothetical protein
MSAKQPTLNKLLNTAAIQGNPIEALRAFLDQQDSFEKAKQIDKMRFVGYVLDLGYDTARIITSDPYKLAVGGIPRGSFLIMTPTNPGNLPPHFTLLRVTGVSPTPLSNQVQQTYFELHKKAMPELDVWTQSELQWGALDCNVLGMFYADPADMRRLAFSGDVNNVVSAHRYKVFSPDEPLLKIIVNGTVKPDLQFEVGSLRTMECQLVSAGAVPKIPVRISMSDFKGCRTAMFGKTRLGKSNVVKLIAQGMLEATKTDNTVGQLIFDINGEYANDNPQDGNRSIRSAYDARCQVYALTARPSTPSKPLRLNFYEQPDSCLPILGSLMREDSRNSIYIQSFASVQLQSIEAITKLPPADKVRPIRRIQMYWAILNKAGYSADEKRLRGLGLASTHTKHFDPHFDQNKRTDVYRAVKKAAPPSSPSTLDELQAELETFASYVQDSSNPALTSSSGKAMFEADDLALLNFLVPTSGAGPAILRPYMAYHSAQAGAFVDEIIKLLDEGRTVILDLGNATDEIRRYFSNMLSGAVFARQEQKFVSNTLGDHFVQLYFGN